MKEAQIVRSLGVAVAATLMVICAAATVACAGGALYNLWQHNPFNAMLYGLIAVSCRLAYTVPRGVLMRLMGKRTTPAVFLRIGVAVATLFAVVCALTMLGAGSAVLYNAHAVDLLRALMYVFVAAMAYFGYTTNRATTLRLQTALQ